jgi:hypothetical protein
MIQKKDIDSKFVRKIEIGLKDMEEIKDQINTLNENDIAIEKNLNETLSSFTKQVSETINTIAKTLNDLIEKDEKDFTKVYEEFTKLYKVMELREKTDKEAYTKLDQKLETFMKNINSIEGYFKQENGKLKGIKLPEKRLFDDKFHIETVIETIVEQPIHIEVEKKVTPIITKSMLEHYFDYGVKLSEEVMAPKYIQGYDKLQVDKTPEQFYKNNKRIILFRFIRTLLLVFLEDGTTEITNVAKGTSIYKGNIIKDIKAKIFFIVTNLIIYISI